MTDVLIVDPAAPDPEAIARAASLIQEGRLVAFPTETVYGLGANALDDVAVRRIFEAKGRPANNPLIVHVPDVAGVRRVASTWPDGARLLAERFWPGPLTLVLPRRPEVPDVVTGGGATVAVRIPAHPVALALLRAAATPIAAPSANRSTHISPTRAAHVLRSLQGRIDLILDAGPTTGGLESTVLDLSTDTPRLLRPGLLTVAEIEAVIGPVDRGPAPATSAAPLASPGLMARHYAPQTELILTTDDGASTVRELVRAGRRVGWMPIYYVDGALSGATVTLSMPLDAPSYAAQLYAALHDLDAAGLDVIVAQMPPDAPEWLAIRDRLRRAAHRSREG